MRKFAFLVGGAVGFVLGSRAGQGPYRQLETQVRKLAGRRDVQATLRQAEETAAGKIRSTGVSAGTRSAQGPAASAGAGGAEPGTLMAERPGGAPFGEAAAAKEDRLDTALAQGADLTELDETEGGA